MLSSNPTPNPPLNAGLASSHDGHSWSVAVGWVCLIWFISVVGVCGLGYCQIWRHFSSRPRKAHSSASSQAPHVTVIRPVKGLEPYLYECLAATFRQDYPREKLTVYFCVATKDDPAYPILQRLIADFPHADARIFVEEEDPLLQDDGSNTYQLGPNPKIRNMSRAYREAKGDVVWIIDCNVWVGRGVCGRMVDRLCGYGSASGMKYKFVHHLPIAVDVQQGSELGEAHEPLLREFVDGYAHHTTNADTNQTHDSCLESMFRRGGGRLEELFLSSSHAKMYTAINTVLIAPCIVGKSNMFRRSHLDYLTPPSPTDPHPRHPGIDFFSDNICEDHLIGDLLWRNQVKEEKELSERWGKHALVFGDLAIQPIANMSVQAYLSRRVRWQRVRKFTVLLATLVEPGTESILCSLYGAWGVTTALAGLLQDRGYPLAEFLSTWPAFVGFFLVSMCIWVLVDWTLYVKLHSAQTVELDDDTPAFSQPNSGTAITRRPFSHWFAAWLGRECLALPIWIWAFYGGVTVTWRDRRFKVGLDMKVRAVDSLSHSPSPRFRSPRHDCPPSETRCRSRNCSRNQLDGRYKVRHD